MRRATIAPAAPSVILAGFASGVFSLEQCVEHGFRRLDGMALSPRHAASSGPTSQGAALPTVTSCLWYRAVLCDSLIAAKHVAMLREHFEDALEADGWPDGACLFMSGGHTAVFFSPAAIAAVPHLIVVCGAKPSPPPDRTGATLIVGKESDWDLLPRELH